MILKKGVAQGIAQGKLEEACAIILRQGAKRFGQPAEATEAAIRAITDQARLERLTDRILDATTWDDLLATP
jgi:hypothetical protein